MYIYKFPSAPILHEVGLNEIRKYLSILMKSIHTTFHFIIMKKLNKHFKQTYIIDRLNHG